MFEYIVYFSVYEFKFKDGVKALQFAEDLREHYVVDEKYDVDVKIDVNMVSPVETTAK